MNKYLITISILSISACSVAKDRPELEYQFPTCGTSQLNGQAITKVCATRDFIAPEPRKRQRDWLAFLAAEGSSGFKGPRDLVGGILHFENKELDMQGHVWDFSKQENPILVLEGHDSMIKNGMILNVSIHLGSNSYFAPNFATGEQTNNSSISKNKNPELLNYGFLYADNTFDCKQGTYVPCNHEQLEKLENAQRLNKIQNISLQNMKIQASNINLASWGGGVSNSTLTISNIFNIDGSKATILKNQIILQANPFNNYKPFIPEISNQSKLFNKSSQIFPDKSDTKTAIPSVLYVKFSPDTVIDGNTFTLTHKNDQAYAIVLDHSPRVRITNNTFNGFKVPILMDQWSSIIDDKGNVLNSNQFAGDVTMNRKGEIVKK